MINRRVLVAGGGGSIGSELVRQLAPENSVFVYDLNETAMFDLVEELRRAGYDVQGRVGDIRDLISLDFLFREFKPEVAFQCAARKHVTPSEENPMEAVNVNVYGTHNLVTLARKYEVKTFVNCSTDKAAATDGVMGLTKRLAEIIVRNAGFISVRFGNVLGSQGSVVPIWQRQLDHGKPITVTDANAERYFMSIEQAVALMLEAAEIGMPGDVIVLDLEGSRVNVLDLAKKIVAESGKNLPIEMIGLRRGERLIEELMTADERARAERKGPFWVIPRAI